MTEPLTVNAADRDALQLVEEEVSLARDQDAVDMRAVLATPPLAIEATATTPAVNFVGPVKVLAPERRSVPTPSLVRPHHA
jgi:hypothetical protein